MPQDLQEIIEQAVVDVKKIIADSKRPEKYPFRDRYHHTLRVLNWAIRIQSVEGGDMDVITFAVLFHDTGWEEGTPHADASARIAEEYLSKKGVDKKLIEKVVKVTKNHNKRNMSDDELTIEDKIVMDSDLLDELGVMSIVWDAMAVMMTKQKPSYKKVLERTLEYFPDYLDQRDAVRTQTALKLFNQRLDTYESVVKDFAYELGLENFLDD